MRRSEFLRAIEDEFGARGATLMTDLVLGAVGNRTASEALELGIAPREIWLALCEESGVPAERRYGVGHLDPRRH